MCQSPIGFDELMPKTLATATVDRLLRHAHVCQTTPQRREPMPDSPPRRPLAREVQAVVAVALGRSDLDASAVTAPGSAGCVWARPISPRLTPHPAAIHERSASTMRPARQSLQSAPIPARGAPSLRRRSSPPRRPAERRLGPAERKAPTPESRLAGRCFDEFPHSVRFARRNHIIVGPSMASRPHHRVDVIRRPAPVTPRVQISHGQFGLLSTGNLRDTHRNLAGHERLRPTG